ncbi:MAG TPA: hypothetical protein VHX61_15985 [Rhizomicrobium sp.]|nr:hypothetical protein [Rhizomicrobium sp.]
MRTTLTIDEDVAVALERMRKSRDTSLKQIVNDVLRRGLKEMSAPPKTHRRFRTRAVDLGNPLIGNLDNIAELLAIAEGEDFK